MRGCGEEAVCDQPSTITDGISPHQACETCRIFMQICAMTLSRIETTMTPKKRTTKMEPTGDPFECTTNFLSEWEKLF